MSSCHYSFTDEVIITIIIVNIVNYHHQCGRFRYIQIVITIYGKSYYYRSRTNDDFITVDDIMT